MSHSFPLVANFYNLTPRRLVPAVSVKEGNCQWPVTDSLPGNRAPTPKSLSPTDNLSLYPLKIRPLAYVSSGPRGAVKTGFVGLKDAKFGGASLICAQSAKARRATRSRAYPRVPQRNQVKISIHNRPSIPL